MLEILERLILLFFIGISSSMANEQQEVILAYLENGLSELKNNEKQVALQLLSNELIRDNDLKMSIMPVKSFSEMQRLITDGIVDYAIFK